MTEQFPPAYVVASRPREALLHATSGDLRCAGKALVLTSLLCIVILGGCRTENHTEDEHDHDHEPRAEAEAVSNRIEVPEAVRRNLGITFARVESRPVAQTIRAPGQFELLPEARREYRTMLAGRVELLVRQFDRVVEGDPLYNLASPEWRDLQNKLSEAESTIRQTEARVSSIPTLISAHRRHEEILEENIGFWEARVAQLKKTHESGVISVDELISAQNTLASQRAELAEILEKEADLEGQIVAAQAEHDAAHARFRLLIATASTLLGMDEKELAAPYDVDEHLHTGIHKHEEPETRPVARWRQINEVLVRATVSGTVESSALTSGGWAGTGDLVLTIIDPAKLRFRATGMQSDLGRLASGLPSRIVPPKGGSVDLQDTMEATLTLGLSAEAQGRTLELIAVPSSMSAWARPGVAAYLEVTTAGGQSELAIPLSSVIQDGLSKVFFRRDPSNADKVIRLDADLGVSDGRWVVVKSGVKEGDEVVLDGVYQLMLASSSVAQQGGHFHPDGTFHAGEDE